MSIKLIVLCAALVLIVSCTATNNNNNDQQKFGNQQRQEQLFDSKRIQDHDSFNDQRSHQQQQNTFFRTINHQNPTLIPTLISFPSSSRNINVHDDSNYNFGYTVSDIQTGDIKSHQESRRGDQVQGQYTIDDADGFRRTVIYRADDLNGFDANVHREPTINFQNQQQQQQLNSNNHHQQRLNNNINNQNQGFTSQNQAQPKSISSTQVSKIEDGQQSNYATSTTNF